MTETSIFACVRTQNNVSKVVREMREKKVNYKIIKYLVLLNLNASIYRTFYTKNRAKRKDNRNNQRVSNVLQLLENYTLLMLAVNSREAKCFIEFVNETTSLLTRRVHAKREEDRRPTSGLRMSQHHQDVAQCPFSSAFIPPLGVQPAATTKRHRIIFIGNERLRETQITRRRATARGTAAVLPNVARAGPIYIGHIFVQPSRPDAAIGFEISMPTFRAKAPLTRPRIERLPHLPFRSRQLIAIKRNEARGSDAPGGHLPQGESDDPQFPLEGASHRERETHILAEEPKSSDQVVEPRLLPFPIDSCLFAFCFFCQAA